MGGTFTAIQLGMGRGSPLSSLFGALYLKPLDDALDRAGFHFVRYTDDILFLAPTVLIQQSGNCVICCTGLWSWRCLMSSAISHGERKLRWQEWGKRPSSVREGIGRCPRRRRPPEGRESNNNRK